MIKGMEVIMEGNGDKLDSPSGQFDSLFYEEVMDCLYSMDTRLPNLQQKMWTGLQAYAIKRNNLKTENWLECSENKVRYILWHI